ncbi:MAG: hypothetical protein ACYDD2_06760 [Candidatus Acidiferrales bacterium]
MQIDAMPRHEARLDEKQREPECKNQSVQMQKQWKRGSVEQYFQVVSPRKPGKDNQECADRNPGIEVTAPPGAIYGAIKSPCRVSSRHLRSQE